MPPENKYIIKNIFKSILLKTNVPLLVLTSSGVFARDFAGFYQSIPTTVSTSLSMSARM